MLPRDRQNLLFSATFSDEIKALADKLLDRPQTIEVAPRNSTVDSIAQRVHPVSRDQKSRLLAWLIGHHDWRQVLVFTRTKHGADKVVRSLQGDGIGAIALHGNKSQGQRTKALADFKRGTVEVLVATDIAARGIDIDQLPHVVNYDLPNVPHDYVHRIGRTGRAGADGEAISLMCVDEHAFLRDIERLIKRTIRREVVPGFEPDPNEVPQKIFAQRGRGQGQHQPHGAGRANGGAHVQNGRGRNGSDRRPSPKQGQKRGNAHAGWVAAR
jgi:ATP-dependent RNA helicase RhlE